MSIVAVWSFLGALILCIIIALILYLISQIKSHRSSIREVTVEIRSVKASIEGLAPTAAEVTAIFPAIQRVASSVPDLIEKMGLGARRTEELNKTFEQFLKFAIVSRGVATEADNDSGVYRTPSDAEAVAREEAERVRRMGINIPEDAEGKFYIPKRQ